MCLMTCGALAGCRSSEDATSRSNDVQEALRQRSRELAAHWYQTSPGIQVIYVDVSRASYDSNTVEWMRQRAPHHNMFLASSVPPSKQISDLLDHRFSFFGWVVGESGRDRHQLITWMPQRFQIWETTELATSWLHGAPRDVPLPLISRFEDQYTKQQFHIAHVGLTADQIESFCEWCQGKAVIAFNRGPSRLADCDGWTVWNERLPLFVDSRTSRAAASSKKDTPPTADAASAAVAPMLEVAWCGLPANWSVTVRDAGEVPTLLTRAWWVGVFDSRKVGMLQHAVDQQTNAPPSPPAVAH